MFRRTAKKAMQYGIYFYRHTTNLLCVHVCVCCRLIWFNHVTFEIGFTTRVELVFAEMNWILFSCGDVLWPVSFHTNTLLKWKRSKVKWKIRDGQYVPSFLFLFRLYFHSISFVFFLYVAKRENSFRSMWIVESLLLLLLFIDCNRKRQNKKTHETKHRKPCHLCISHV